MAKRQQVGNVTYGGFKPEQPTPRARRPLHDVRVRTHTPCNTYEDLERYLLVGRASLARLEKLCPDNARARQGLLTRFGEAGLVAMFAAELRTVNKQLNARVRRKIIENNQDDAAG